MLFDIQVEDFPNAFTRVDFLSDLTSKGIDMAEAKSEEKTVRTPRAVSVNPEAVKDMVEWEKFMTGRGFKVTELKIAGTKVVEGIGEKNGKTHVITPELRSEMTPPAGT